MYGLYNPISVEDKPTYIVLTGIKQGDRKCQEMLYRQFHSYGMGICLRYSSTREEAVEILNDGFMKVFLKIDQYDTAKPFAAWFRKILINSAINYYKKNIKHNHNGLDTIPDPPTYQYDILDQLSYKEIVQLIGDLPLAYRTVFNLYVIEGYKHDEIADLLNISIGTSKSNLSRARANLREMLNINHEEGAAKHDR